MTHDTSVCKLDDLGPNEAMHRMSGIHVYSQFDWLWMPLIGDLNR